MPKPKRLSGAQVIHILEQCGFSVERQRGSHITLVREHNARRDVLLIPNHKELKVGTIVAIYKQATRYVSEDVLHPHFYTD